MSDTWEQPDFQSTLEAAAVDLITHRVQQVFAELDPVQLVEVGAPELSEHDRHIVADLIDNAVVEIEVDFSGHDHA